MLTIIDPLKPQHSPMDNLWVKTIILRNLEIVVKYRIPPIQNSKMRLRGDFIVGVSG